jgi:hypothetical protein
LFIILNKHCAFKDIAHFSTFTYVFQGLQLLLLDILTQSVWKSAVRASKFARTAITLGLVVAIDLLCPYSWNTLRDVRSYAVLKAGQEIDRIGIFYLNPGNTCAVAILLLCMRGALTKIVIPTETLHVNNSLKTAAYAIADVVCVASINILLQQSLAESSSSSRLVQFLSVSVTAIMAFSIQKILQS